MAGGVGLLSHRLEHAGKVPVSLCVVGLLPDEPGRGQAQRRPADSRAARRRASLVTWRRTRVSCEKLVRGPPSPSTDCTARVYDTTAMLPLMRTSGLHIVDSPGKQQVKQSTSSQPRVAQSGGGHHTRKRARRHPRRHTGCVLV